MPSPRLPSLPTVVETQFVDAVAGLLAGDAKLVEINASVWDWNGDEDRVIDGKNEPSAEQLPCIRINPTGYPTGWANEGQTGGRFSIEILIYTPGVHRADLINLAGAVRTALFPTDVDLRTARDAALAIPGVQPPRMTSFMRAVGLLGESRYGLKTSMSIDSLIWVNTR